MDNMESTIENLIGKMEGLEEKLDHLGPAQDKVRYIRTKCVNYEGFQLYFDIIEGLILLCTDGLE